MAPTSRLPLEVLERIIDEAAENDLSDIPQFYNKLSSIKSCALVCHSFLPLCRKHIFASVALNAQRPYSPTSDNLDYLLSNSPHLAVYIRKLKYFVTKREFVAKRLLWLLPMFKKLVKLRKLSIIYSPAGVSARGKVLDWMSSSVRKVLLPLLHFPTLTSIKLSSIDNFPLADLAYCVNLKKLKILDLECSNGVGKFLETLPTAPVMLERLEIRRSIKHVQQLCDARRPDGKPIIDFSSLKEISATATRLDSLTELFGMCRNLHKIELGRMSLSLPYCLHPFDVYSYTIVGSGVNPDPSEDTSSLKGLFSMLKPSLPTLVDISIDYFDGTDDDDETDDKTDDGPLTGLCHELEKMVGQNFIETIEILIWVQPLVGWGSKRWCELQKLIIGSLEGWPALKRVSLLVQVIIYDSEDKGFEEMYMTKLVESKQLLFEIDFRSIRVNL